MKTYPNNTYKDDYSFKVNILNEARLRLDRINDYFTYLSDKTPESLERIIKEFENYLQKINKNPTTNYTATNITNNLAFLRKHTKLLNLCINAYFSLINFEKYKNSITNDEITINAKDYLRGFLHLNYYSSKSLLAVMDKMEAINFYKEFIDFNTITKKKIEKIEQVNKILFVNSTPPDVFKHAFNFTEFEIDSGTVGVKVSKCKWCEVMKDFNDPNFCYAVCCHYDFTAAKMYNENFVLTRTQTLMQNKPYCDFVWHDTRLDPKPQHPDKNFWKKLK